MKTHIYFTRIRMMIAIGMASMLAAPLLAFAWGQTPATGTPVISNVMTQSITDSYAIVTITYNSSDARYPMNMQPKIYIQYSNTMNGSTLLTEPQSQFAGARTVTFMLKYLRPGMTYSYMPIMQYNGRTIYGTAVYFTTPTVITTQEDPTVITVQRPGFSTRPWNTTTNTVRPLPTVGINPAPAPISVKPIGNFFARVKEKAEDSVKTGGSATKDGVILAMTNTSAKVMQGDVLEYRIQYRNTNEKSLQNGTLTVFLPPQYQFLQDSFGATVDDQENTVTFALGRIPAGLTKTITFTARAVGDGSGELQTVATLSYDGGELSVEDTDAFRSGSQAPGGTASLFGAGFFPQTFLGWFLVILLLGLVVMLVRRYVKSREKAKMEKERTVFESKDQ